MKTIVVIPTYNEKENISNLIKAILALKIKNLEILVVDDNSPDRTADIVKKQKAHLLLRKGKRGRGLAGIAGFKKALENKADYIIEMDADFSHDPKYIPIMLKEIKKYDIVLGSRLVKGSKDKERSLSRKIITTLANAYVRTILNIKLKDVNSGYRCFRRKVLESVISDLKASGPDIVQEVLYKSVKKGYKVKEIPIEFKERHKGSSKLGLKQFIRGLIIVFKVRK
jgi:dolichol-phosphate mannosyltransferase